MAGSEITDPHGLEQVPEADFGSKEIHEWKKRAGTTSELSWRPYSL